MKYKVILFDADGMTLISKRFSEQIQKDYEISREKIKLFFGKPFLQCKLGKADLKFELAKVIEDWGWKGTVDELMEYWFSIGSTPDHEVITIADELRSRDVKCFLATNQEKYRAEYLWDVVGLKSFFDGFLVSADLGHTKEEVAFFEEAYKRINAMKEETIPKESILFVDHEEEKISAARAFGFDIFRYRAVNSFKKYVLNE